MTFYNVVYRPARPIADRIKHVTDATVPPSSSDDGASKGFSVGSTWVDQSTGLIYHCLDASTGAAEWALFGPVYEEGSFVPTLSFGTAGDQNIVLDGDYSFARYTRIGRIVSFEIGIETTTFTHSTAAGSLYVGTFPWDAQITEDIYIRPKSTVFRGASWDDIFAYMQGGSPELYFGRVNGGDIDYIGPADVPSGGLAKWIYISGQYEIDLP
jgi:hypothetical protein